MVKSGLSVRYKNGDKSNYVRRGPNYHIPLRNPCEQKNPTEPLKRPLFPLLYCRSKNISTKLKNNFKSVGLNIKFLLNQWLIAVK